MTAIRARLTNVTDARRETDVDMTVDSGAIYSVVPSSILEQLGVAPRRWD